MTPEQQVSEHIRRLVADAPPLTEQQKQRLTLMLRPTTQTRRAA